MGRDVDRDGRRIGTAAAESTAEQLLASHWKPSAIAKEIRCSTRSVERWGERLQIYRSFHSPHSDSGGRPRRITTAAKQSLLEYQSRNQWGYQDEMVI